MDGKDHIIEPGRLQILQKTLHGLEFVPESFKEAIISPPLPEGISDSGQIGDSIFPFVLKFL